MQKFICKYILKAAVAFILHNIYALKMILIVIYPFKEIVDVHFYLHNKKIRRFNELLEKL